MFEFDIPGVAVGREVSRLSIAVDERKSACRSLIGEIDKTARPVNDRPVRRVCRNDLLRVTRESIDAQRYAVIKQAEAAAHCRLPILKRHPHKANARRGAQGSRDVLPLHAHAEIEAEGRLNDPMILREKINFEIAAAVRLAAAEFNAFDKPPGGIENVDRAGNELAAICRVGERGAELDVVRTEMIERLERNQFDPLLARGLAILLAKVIATI